MSNENKLNLAEELSGIIAASEKRLESLNAKVSAEKETLAKANKSLKDNFTPKEIKAVHDLIQVRSKLLESFGVDLESEIPETGASFESKPEVKTKAEEKTKEEPKTKVKAEPKAKAKEKPLSEEDERLSRDKKYVQSSYNKGRSEFLSGAEKKPPYGKNKMRNNAYILGYEEAEEAKNAGKELAKMTEKNSAKRMEELAAFSDDEKGNEDQTSVSEVAETNETVETSVVETPEVPKVTEKTEEFYDSKTEVSKTPEVEETPEVTETTEVTEEILVNEEVTEEAPELTVEEVEEIQEDPIDFNDIKTEVEAEDENQDDIPAFLRKS